ncbi:hypothetical protein CSPX01_00449, partial [Colletotrichum filicis]
EARGSPVNTNVEPSSGSFSPDPSIGIRAGEARGCLCWLGVVELYLMGTAGARLRVARC